MTTEHTPGPCLNSQNGLPHCLHYQEGDGDCCTCGKDLQHCDNCGWAGDARAETDPSDDANLCGECGDFICASSRTEDCRFYDDPPDSRNPYAQPYDDALIGHLRNNPPRNE